MNLKGILKAAIAGATMIGGAVLGLEAKKCFTKAVEPDDEDDLFCEETETTEATEDPAEEADSSDEPAEEAED